MYSSITSIRKLTMISISIMNLITSSNPFGGY